MTETSSHYFSDPSADAIQSQVVYYAGRLARGEIGPEAVPEDLHAVIAVALFERVDPALGED